MRINFGRARTPLLMSVACLAALAAIPPASSETASRPAAYKPPPGTIGLVISNWRYALVESPKVEECSLGVQKGEVAQYKAMPNYKEHLKKFGGSFQIRGPNGETGGFNPMDVEDPLPFSELTTKVGYGMNLDGTTDGKATAKTCKHEKFTSPEGEKVDNQIARVVGCVQGYRTGGMMHDYYVTEVQTFSVNRHLIEVTGVDSEVNDPSVDVSIYKGVDRLVRLGEEFISGQSHRVDERFPRYYLKTRGKIVDGVLITDPIPEAVMPRSQERQIGDRLIRDMTLRLKLTENGAEGMMAGYENNLAWWSPHAKLVVSEVGQFSSPNMYRALMRYADGYPDPTTGQCTHISAAYQIKATRAIIVQPKKPSVVSEKPSDTRVASLEK